jgi:hypothetical protein
MPAEHLRPDGKLYQGYYCTRCGAAGVNMLGTGHGEARCEPDPELVRALLFVNGRKVVVTCVCPPIPLRQFDWSATLDGYEPPETIGYGATSLAAVLDLMEQLENRT